MKLQAFKTHLSEILPLRALFLQENNMQIRYNARHERGWCDSYILNLDGKAIGYGSIMGKEELEARDCIFEFYIIPSYRKLASVGFQEILTISGASFIECQSNDLLLSSLLYEFGSNIYADVVLFEDHQNTDYVLPELIFRAAKNEDEMFRHTTEPEGDYVLEMDGAIVATGGFMLHYNQPFADLYMEVKESHRRKGLGSFLLQELKKACFQFGRVPAARCNIENKASRGCLEKAGMRVCGFMLEGEKK